MVIDLKNIKSVEDLHLTFKQKLNFPDYYGENWDAFWDLINSGYIPEKLILENWNDFSFRFPEHCKILGEMIAEFNRGNTEKILRK